MRAHARARAGCFGPCGTVRPLPARGGPTGPHRRPAGAAAGRGAAGPGRPALLRRPARPPQNGGPQRWRRWRGIRGGPARPRAPGPRGPPPPEPYPRTRPYSRLSRRRHVRGAPGVPLRHRAAGRGRILGRASAGDRTRLRPLGRRRQYGTVPGPPARPPRPREPHRPVRRPPPPRRRPRRSPPGCATPRPGSVSTSATASPAGAPTR